MLGYHLEVDGVRDIGSLSHQAVDRSCKGKADVCAAIISTNVAAIPEFVRNGETGLTVPVGDAASLTQALRDLATNPAFRMVLGERAMAHASRDHDAPTNASRLLGLLKAEANAARADRLAASTERYA